VARQRCRILAIAAGAMVLAGCELPSFGAPDPASSQGDRVLSLWQLFVVLGLAVALIVWVLLAVAIIRFRRRGDDEGLPSQKAHNGLAEAIYTGIPIAVVIVLFAVSWRAEGSITELRHDPDVEVEVLAFQWQWRFTYGDGTVVQGTEGHDPQLVLPLGERVRFRLLTADVIHSFWVPHFLEKRDMIPEVDNVIEITPNRLGTFGGVCAEYCGLDHWRMRFTVKVVTPEDYEAWLDDQAAAK